MQQDGGKTATAVVELGPERQRLMSRSGQSPRPAPTLAKGPQELLPPDSGRLPGRERTAARARAVGVVAVLMDLAAVAAGYQLAGQVVPPLLWFSLAVWPLTFALYGLYSPRRVLSASEEARRLFHSVTVSTVAVIFLIYALDAETGREWVAAMWLACLLSTGAVRLAERKLVHLLRVRQVLGVRLLVVGTSEEARLIARTLARQPWLGYRPTGFVAVDSPVPASIDGLPVVGTVEDLSATVRRVDAGAVILSASVLEPLQLSALCATLQALDVEVRVSPGLTNVAASRVEVEPLDGLPMLAVQPNQLDPSQATVKRATDIVGGVLALLVAAPFMAVIAVLVKLTSPGPVIFSQVRVGEGGKPFRFFKFRTMVADAESRRVDLVDRNEADGLLFKMADDPRVTSIGRVLRRWGLDELPQLWNVLRGEMSLVGPRPPLPEESLRYDEWVWGRLRVRPGLTGLWQVNGRHALSFADYVRYDLFYVANWSVSLDLYVLARTIPALLSGRGSY